MLNCAENIFNFDDSHFDLDRAEKKIPNGRGKGDELQSLTSCVPYWDNIPEFRKGCEYDLK